MAAQHFPLLVLEGEERRTGPCETQRVGFKPTMHLPAKLKASFGITGILSLKRNGVYFVVVVVAGTKFGGWDPWTSQK